MRDVLVAGAVRTPIGRFGGGLAGLTAAELGAAAARESLRRAGLRPDQVDETIFGCARQAGGGPNPARQVSWRAGVPQESEALIGVNIIESWTEDEIVFRWDTRSKTGPQTASFRDTLTLKSLTLRVESTMRLGALTPHPSAYPGRCKRVAFDPAAAK